MTLSIDKAQEKYGDYLLAVKDLENQLLYAGLRIEKSNEFELGAEWNIWNGDSKVGVLEWNVPHYLIFTSVIRENESFSLDYIKNCSDWVSFLGDVRESLVK